MLNLSRDWLNTFLPHILAKIDRVSFGLLNEHDYERAIQLDPLMPRTRAKLAIPFVGKDVPSRSSEFAHPDVIIGLTILGYRYEGMPFLLTQHTRWRSYFRSFMSRTSHE